MVCGCKGDGQPHSAPAPLCAASHLTLSGPVHPPSLSCSLQLRPGADRAAHPATAAQARPVAPAPRAAGLPTGWPQSGGGGGPGGPPLRPQAWDSGSVAVPVHEAASCPAPLAWLSCSAGRCCALSSGLPCLPLPPCLPSFCTLTLYFPALQPRPAGCAGPHRILLGFAPTAASKRGAGARVPAGGGGGRRGPERKHSLKLSCNASTQRCAIQLCIYTDASALTWCCRGKRTPPSAPPPPLRQRASAHHDSSLLFSHIVTA